MKRLFFILFLFSSLILYAQQNGYEIRITLKPIKNQYIYLGHHYGKQLPIIDSTRLNDKNQGVFKGDKKLGGGIYLIGYPDKSNYFEFLIDKEQKFSIIADTSKLRKNISFLNSPDNVLFAEYQKFIDVKGKELDQAYKQRTTSTTAADSAKWNAVIDSNNKEIHKYREELINKYPGSTISTLFKAMKEPEISALSKQPSNKNDSNYVFRYFKSHYWDGVNFFDERLVRTPFFEPKLDKYFEKLVYPNPDSVIKEIDWMLGYASANEEMQKFLLLKFINRYLNQRYMWEDAVFVHLFEKYISQRTYPWLTDQGRKVITDRAYSLMANIFGTPAADIDLPDTTGKNISLYSLKAPFVVVAIWDPTCSHCKEIIPKLDSFYQHKWKQIGLRMFGLAKETEGKKKDWLDFIKNNNLGDWTHVYYSKVDDKARTDAGIPGYSQLYDVLTFPTLYLLDKDKRIIAKKLTYQQIDEVLEYKKKNQ